MPDLAADSVAFPLVKSAAPLAGVPGGERGLGIGLLSPGQRHVPLLSEPGHKDHADDDAEQERRPREARVSGDAQIRRPASQFFPAYPYRPPPPP